MKLTLPWLLHLVYSSTIKALKFCKHSKIVKNAGKLLESHYKANTHTQSSSTSLSTLKHCSFTYFEMEILLHCQMVLNFRVQVILPSQSPKLLEPYACTTLSDWVIFNDEHFQGAWKLSKKKGCWISDIHFAFCFRGRHIPLNLWFFIWHEKNNFYMSKSCNVFSNHFCVVNISKDSGQRKYGW